MREPALLADHLDRRTDEILAVWRATVERVGDVPEAEKLTHAEFVDHVPAILDRLADRLRGLPADASVEGKKHGELRWRQGYDIAELVAEYGHLRTALSRATVAYATEHDWGLERLEAANEAINDVLFDAIAESVRQFQVDSRAETQAALAEVKRRQQSLEDAWFSARVEQTKLQAILSSLPAAVWVVDHSGTLVGVNAEAERLQGYPRSEAVGRFNVRQLESGLVFRKPDGSCYAPEDLPVNRALHGETVRQEEVSWGDGPGRLTLSVNAGPLVDDGGAILGAVVVALDITARKALEASLAASEARFRTIAEKSPVMIWRVGVDGRCDYLNQTYLEFRGRTLEQEAGDGWLEGIHPDDRPAYLAALRSSLDRRASFEHAFRLIRRDGEERWLSSRGAPYFDGGGQFLGLLGSCLDITARIELERILERQWEKAEASSRHKSRLVSALSHDARTPLNAVVLAAELLEAHLNGEPDGEVQECLKTIRHSVRNLLDLLGDLLDLSKIDAGALPTEVTRFPLLPVLSECLASIEPQARVKGLDVRLEPGNLADATLETDRSKLKQILSNLLSNALRYTERGSIRLVAERTADRVCIAVEDTGVGISPDDQGRIFEEFTTLQGERGRAGLGQGTGLGLAICRRLAVLLQGEIALRSAPGEGSTFTLALPSSVLTLTPPPEPGGPGIGAPGSGTVLIAEDHPDSRRTLAKVLKRMGYRVLEADNGLEALEIVRRERLTAVLMDVNMPVMDGIAATQAIRADERFRDLAIFALTGDVTLDNRHRIGEVGVNGYLEKPVTLESLRHALGSVNAPPEG